jgi:hypothetical protein
MKNLVMRSTAIMGLFFMLAMVSVQAQTPSRAEVSIPFDFSAGKAALKAGTYGFKRMAGNAIAISTADGKPIALVNAPLTIGSRDFKAGERLVFNKYGEDYFLSQVWLTVDSGRQLFTSGGETKTAREYKLAKNNAKPERVEIAVSKR